MRFAFYGRVSTEDQQDPRRPATGSSPGPARSSRPRGGEIVAEFFDIGQSRSLPWKRRPEARRLLDAFQRPRPRLRRRRDRRTAARLLRQPVRPHVPGVRPLRRRAVGARGRRRRRSRLRGARPRHEPLRRHEQGRAQPDQDPGAHGDGRASRHRRPVPRWPTALRLLARRRRAPPEPRQGGDRQAPAPPRARPDAAPVVQRIFARVHRLATGSSHRRRPDSRRRPFAIGA